MNFNWLVIIMIAMMCNTTFALQNEQITIRRELWEARYLAENGKNPNATPAGRQSDESANSAEQCSLTLTTGARAAPMIK